MRIALDPRRLLGFQGVSTRLDAPVVAAKVGNKPTIGIRVATASSSPATDTASAIDHGHLTYPVVIDR
jgi:hypothetical protein